jgi:hypothetical protein
MRWDAGPVVKPWAESMKATRSIFLIVAAKL